MSYNKHDHNNSIKHLEDNGFKKQQNGSGWHKGGTVFTPDGDRWKDNRGNTYPDPNRLKNSKNSNR